MKNAVKRLVCAILVAIMVVGLFPFPFFEISVNAASNVKQNIDEVFYIKTPKKSNWELLLEKISDKLVADDCIVSFNITTIDGYSFTNILDNMTTGRNNDPIKATVYYKTDSNKYVEIKSVDLRPKENYKKTASLIITALNAISEYKKYSSVVGTYAIGEAIKLPKNGKEYKIALNLDYNNPDLDFYDPFGYTSITCSVKGGSVSVETSNKYVEYANVKALNSNTANVSPAQSDRCSFSNCKSESYNQNISKTVSTNNSDQIINTTFSGTINNPYGMKINSYGFYVKKESNNLCGKDILVSSNSATYSKTINARFSINTLEPDTVYYYALYARTDNSIYCSNIYSFKTPKVRPKNITINSVNTIEYKTNVEMMSNELGIGDSVMVKWAASKYADYYTIKVNGVEQQNKIYGTQTAVQLTQVGDNTISVQAHNEVGDSDWTSEKTAIVHEDVKLIYYSGNEKSGYYEYKNTMLTWNHCVDNLPLSPSRFGACFAGWYNSPKDDGSLITSSTRMKEDTKIYSTFIDNKFKVRFLDYYGDEISVNVDSKNITEQIVTYGESAVEPDSSKVRTPKGYHFIGWSDDFTNVKSSKDIYAIFDSDNTDMQVRVTKADATRYPSRYVVNCTIENRLAGEDFDTQGRVIVALKNKEGRLITTTESYAYYIEANSSVSGETTKNSCDLQIIVPIDESMDISGYVADVAEIYLVKDFKTTIPVGEHYTVDIEDCDPWSAWSTKNDTHKYLSALAKGDDYVDSKAQYRYKDLQKAVVYSYDEKTKMVDEGWVWDASSQKTGEPKVTESKTKPEALENREIKEKTVNDTKTVTKYAYKRYRYYKGNTLMWSYSSTWANNNGYSGYWEYKLTDTKLSAYAMTSDGCYMRYGNSSDWWFEADCSNQGNYTTKTVKQTVNNGSHKEYVIYDYPYQMTRWPDQFTQWDDTSISEIADQREVETRNLYRYKTDMNDKDSYTDDGILREEFCCGTLADVYGNDAAKLEGKQLTLFIYKVNEASDWTTECIAQTTIDEDGSYFFDPYILREEPSPETGDFTVMLAVEGATAPIYLGKIEVPDSEYKYTVEFIDSLAEGDNRVISKQIVSRNSDAEIPEPPVHEGYEFSHWDMRNTAIQSNTVINAIYKEKECTVVYVDMENETSPVTISYAKYGSEIDPPDAFSTDELDFVGWDSDGDGKADNTTNVTDDTIVYAVYEKKECTVQFMNIMSSDNSNEIAETQTVVYGDSPTKPTLEHADDVYLMGWALADNSEEIVNLEYLDIKEDTTLVPVYYFENTTEAPSVSIETGSYNSAQRVTLNCATSDALIYYTLDGTYPLDSETSFVCEPGTTITINESCQLNAIACCFNMNNSIDITEYYVINNGKDIEKYVVKYFIAGYEPYFDVGIVEKGKTILNTIPEIEGYKCIGAYKEFDSVKSDEYEDGDIVYSDPWNISTDTITEDTTLYLEYTPNTYTVKFLDYDGIVLGKEEVTYLSSTVEPKAPVREGYVFTGWDTYDFECVTNDMEVNAVYVDENEYVTVSLNKEKFTTMTGSSFNLNATVFGNADNSELTWYSDDADVVTVDQEGNVYAVGAGTANVTVVVSETNESSTCFVTVMANPDEEFSLTKYSHITISDSGFARGFTVKTDGDYHSAETVSEVKEQFANTDLVFTDINGNVLSDEEFVGTGTTIELIKDGDVKDKVTVIVSGDVDGDGYITNMDASRIARYLVGKDSYTDIQIAAMDVNGSDTVSNVDVSLVLRYLVGKETI